ncbi:MAG: hypothetical protein PHE89_07245 [Alphaproteobacteria bacterium]|nr:hypothetical protein [Alphaproteobacteria bacterium]
MSENVDIQITKETKEDLIYKTGWLTILPIGIWYVFYYLFNVGALSFYGIISGYSEMRVEIDFFSTIFIGGLFFACLILIYNLVQEKIRVYKLLVIASMFFIDIVLFLFNWILGLGVAVCLGFSLSFLLKKNVLRGMSQYRKNIIIITSFIALFVFSFGTGYFYSKKYSDYYCVNSSFETGKKLVLVARLNQLTGVFVDSEDIHNNFFDKNKYYVKTLIGQELHRCDIEENDGA